MPIFSQHRAAQDARADARPSAVPPTGTAASSLLRRYRPLETRATGGFGSVEICLDKRLQRRVAIKRMPLTSPEVRTSLETVSAALSEARNASLLSHPNIVSVIDFTYDAAFAYLVMEYVDGMSLAEFLANVEGHSLTFDEAAYMADALSQALAFAHANGVLHLDIKPANVLIDRSGHVKLADFGMSRLTDAAGLSGARGGTIGYMAPEQLLGGAVDSRSDVFSLATVLYEALCACAPFRAGTPADSLKNIERGVLYPTDLLPDMPESCEGALLSGLAPHPEDRTGDVLEFADAFCTGLGNPREGRRSLSRIIERLLADDVDGEPDEAAERTRVWELDPAEGHLGSRWPQARRVAVGAVGGVSAAAASLAALSALGLTDPLAAALASLAVGATAAAAPQAGSALLATGLVMVMLSAQNILLAFFASALTLALVGAWWFVWGRASAACSSIAASAVGIALALPGASSAAAFLPVAALAGFFLPRREAAVSASCGLLFAYVFSSVAPLGAAAGGGAGLAAALGGVLANPGTWLAPAAAGALAAGVSAALDLTRRRMLDARGTGTVAIACALPALAALAVSAGLLCLASLVEIGAGAAGAIPAVMGAGALSSIIVLVCVYALGYRRDSPEVDRP